MARKPELSFHRKGNEILVVEPRAPSWSVLNHSAKTVLDLFDAHADIGRVSEEFAKIYGLSLEDARFDVESALSGLLEAGLCCGEEERPQPETSSVPGVLTRELHLELTRSCNLDCSHCYVGDRERAGEILGYREVANLLDDYSRLEGSERVVLSGGEPLSHPDIRKIAEHAYGKGLKVTVITNGMLIDGETARWLRQTEAEILLSLEGICPESNDAIRGEGSFSKAIAGLEWLVRTGSAKQTSISMTINAFNLQEIEKVAEMAAEKGLGGVNFSHLFRSGNALNNPGQFLDDRGMMAATRAIRSAASKYQPQLKVTGDYWNTLAAKLRNATAPQNTGCSMGSAIYVDSKGSVFPCRACRDEIFSLGDFRGKSLKAMLEGKVLKGLREEAASRIKNNPLCVACEWRKFCHGGCLGEAYIATGELQGDFPRCKLNKELFKEIAFAETRKC